MSYVKTRPRHSQDSEACKVPNLPKSVDRGGSETPTMLYGDQPLGMAKNRASDSRDNRYHDVTGRDEKKILFRQ